MCSIFIHVSDAFDIILLWKLTSTHHCRVTRFGDIHLGQHWLRYSLLPDDNKPFPGLMWNCYYLDPVAFGWERFHSECPSYYTVVYNECENYTFQNTATSPNPKGQWVTETPRHHMTRHICYWYSFSSSPFSDKTHSITIQLACNMTLSQYFAL